MSALFFKELKLSRRSLMYWCLVLFLTALMGVVEYPLVFDNLEIIMGSIDIMPRIVKIMFGVEGLDFTSALDYYLTMYYYYTLVAFTFAVHVGYYTIAKEEKYKTAEYIYTKPFKKHQIILVKGAVGILNIAVLAGVSAMVSIEALLPVLKALDLVAVVLKTTFALFLSQLVFLVIGMLCALLFHAYQKGMVVAYLWVVLAYGLSVMIQYVTTIDYLIILTPFQYFNAEAVSSQGLNLVTVVTTLLLSGLVMVIIAYRYEKRELVF